MKTVVGLFKTPRDAQGIAGEFTRLGLPPSRIGFLAPEGQASAGAKLLDLPDVGRVAADGLMLQLLDEATLRGDSEGIFGSLLRMGVSRTDASRCIAGIKQGGVLEAVMVEDGKEADALALMQGRFARQTEPDVETPAPTTRPEGAVARSAAEPERTAARSASEPEYATHDTGAPSRPSPSRSPSIGEPAPAARTRTTDEVVIPIIREELRVGKRDVDAGGVRVTTRIETKPVEQTVTVREERIRIERRVVDRPVGLDDEGYRDRTLEFSATSDEPVIAKHARVVEEIRVHKDTTERVERVHDNLRHTAVDVADLSGERAAAPRSGSIDPAFEFGRQLRARMPDRSWAELEAPARDKWEQTNPRTWDRFSGSIKAGWEAKD